MHFYVDWTRDTIVVKPSRAVKTFYRKASYLYMLYMYTYI